MICSQAKKGEYGFEIQHELSGKADANKLEAKVLFQVTKLFDISGEEDLSVRATEIGKWFVDHAY